MFRFHARGNRIGPQRELAALTAKQIVTQLAREFLLVRPSFPQSNPSQRGNGCGKRGKGAVVFKLSIRHRENCDPHVHEGRCPIGIREVAFLVVMSQATLAFQVERRVLPKQIGETVMSLCEVSRLAVQVDPGVERHPLVSLPAQGPRQAQHNSRLRLKRGGGAWRNMRREVFEPARSPFGLGDLSDFGESFRSTKRATAPQISKGAVLALDRFPPIKEPSSTPTCDSIHKSKVGPWSPIRRIRPNVLGNEQRRISKGTRPHKLKQGELRPLNPKTVADLLERPKRYRCAPKARLNDRRLVHLPARRDKDMDRQGEGVGQVRRRLDNAMGMLAGGIPSITAGNHLPAKRTRLEYLLSGHEQLFRRHNAPEQGIVLFTRSKEADHRRCPPVLDRRYAANNRVHTSTLASPGATRNRAFGPQIGPLRRPMLKSKAGF